MNLNKKMNLFYEGLLEERKVTSLITPESFNLDNNLMM